MVRIVDYKTYQREDGTDFHALVVQGGVESVRSKVTQRNYLTARKASVACTFNQRTCESLIGSELPGKIQKVEVDTYDYMVPETGEMIELSHRYEYLSDDEVNLNNHLIEEELVS